MYVRICIYNIHNNYIYTIHCVSMLLLLSATVSVYDLEPQKLTGIVKYVGKVDSEFVDNRIYAGVKLDEPGTV